MTNARKLLKGTTPAFGSGEARVAWIAAEQALVDTYLAEYTMTLNSGADYTPSGWERTLIEDALQGFLVEHDELLGQHLARQVIDLSAQLAEVREVGNRLSIAAQTSGGVAGRDEGLIAAIDAWSTLLANGDKADALLTQNKEPKA